MSTRATAKQKHLLKLLENTRALQANVHEKMKVVADNIVSNSCFKLPLGPMLDKVESAVESFLSSIKDHRELIHNYDFVFRYLFNVMGEVLCLGIAGEDRVLMGEHVDKYMALLREALEEHIPELFETEMLGGRYKRHPFGKYVSERNTYALDYRFFAIVMHVAVTYANCISFLQKDDVMNVPDRVVCSINQVATRNSVANLDPAQAERSMALYLKGQQKRSDSSIRRESSEARRRVAQRENERRMLRKARAMALRVQQTLRRHRSGSSGRKAGTRRVGRRTSKAGGGGGGGGGMWTSRRRVSVATMRGNGARKKRHVKRSRRKRSAKRS